MTAQLRCATCFLPGVALGTPYRRERAANSVRAGLENCLSTLRQACSFPRTLSTPQCEPPTHPLLHREFLTLPLPASTVLRSTAALPHSFPSGNSSASNAGLPNQCPTPGRATCSSPNHRPPRFSG